MTASRRRQRSDISETSAHSRRCWSVSTAACSADGARGRSSSVGSSPKRLALFARSRQASRRRLTVSQRTTANGSLMLSLLRTRDMNVCWTTSSASAADRPHCRAVCQSMGLTRRTRVSMAPGTPLRYSSKAVPARTTRSPTSRRRSPSGVVPRVAGGAVGAAGPVGPVGPVGAVAPWPSADSAVSAETDVAVVTVSWSEPITVELPFPVDDRPHPGTRNATDAGAHGSSRM